MGPVPFLSIKSKLGVEFRRYALRREDVKSFENFYRIIESFHHLQAIPFFIYYQDSDGCYLPINNDNNLAQAIGLKNFYSNNHMFNYNNSFELNNNNNNLISNNSKQQHSINQRRRFFLKLHISAKHYDHLTGTGGSGKVPHFKGLSGFILSNGDRNPKPSIGMPEDFRQVSSIIDVENVPETCRRVRIVKHGSDRPLGFYVRDGTYKRINAYGQLELATGIFISRLIPGGLAESTGLLAVNDEVLEVNGIQVTHGKTLDQVTDMMIANSSNLIMTIRPGKTNKPS